jgi:hypothetical protein
MEATSVTRERFVVARSLAVLLGAGALLTACSEPGSLMIVLGEVPRVTASTTVAIPGVVTRVPAKETEIVVTATGGSAPATDTVSADGTFAVSVLLTRNTEATITLTAEDGTGAVSPPVTVTVRQDLQRPQITTFTPTGADVSTTPTVEVTFNEPVKLSGPSGVQLLSRGSPVPASALLSSDSLTVTLSLGRLLSRNSAYVLSFPGVTDLAGNGPDESASAACFVTVNSAPASVNQPDSTDDLWQLGTPVDPSPSDIDQLRLSLESDTLFGVMRFTTARSFGSDTVSNNVWVYLDIDLDQDSTTGFLSNKDLAFGPDLSSGLGVEGAIWVDTFSSFGGSAVAGAWADSSSINVADTFVPDVCGPYVGFAVPFAALGSDDGNFDYVLVAGNTNKTSSGDVYLADPMPESGHNSVAFAGLFASGVPRTAATESRTRTAVPVRLFPFRFP